MQSILKFTNFNTDNTCRSHIIMSTPLYYTRGDIKSGLNCIAKHTVTEIVHLISII